MPLVPTMGVGFLRDGLGFFVKYLVEKLDFSMNMVAALPKHRRLFWVMGSWN
jgi:hypothetical protein